MTNDEVKASLHYEARELGHADAKTKQRKACAAALATEGKFKKGGTMTGGGEWWVLTDEHAAKLRADGYRVAPRTGRTYRAWFKRDGVDAPENGDVVYERRQSGNLIGDLPAGTHPLPRGECGTLDRRDGGDPYERALFATASGRTVIVEWQP